MGICKPIGPVSQNCNRTACDQIGGKIVTYAEVIRGERAWLKFNTVKVKIEHKSITAIR